MDGVTKLGKVRFIGGRPAAIRWELEDLAFKFLEPQAGIPAEVVGRPKHLWTTDQSGSRRATLDGNAGGRSPRSVRRQPAEAAEREGTSLNQFMLAAVSEKVGAAPVAAGFVEGARG